MPPQLVELSPGMKVAEKWTIIKKLGAGAFGAVYHCKFGLREGALKTEPVDASMPLLAMEAHVLQELHRIKDDRHFTKCFDIGRDRSSKLLNVKARPGRRFSPGTAIGVSIQMVNALRALHGIGYLHRDIKPANTTTGRKEEGEQQIIYVLDFGIARKFMHSDGSLMRPRESARFRGTPRYAATSAHIKREYARKDDMESWFYMMVEIYAGKLPWSGVGDMDAIGQFKEARLPGNQLKVRTDAVRALVAGCPDEFITILRHIDEMRFYGRPDYSWIMKMLRAYLTENKIPEHPYDWE
uniref:non-specific serine/threonine protein kinase n=1 Tax=Meloidogyne incognita TaxID=6306 RepID=A0A914MT00_MELIC